MIKIAIAIYPKDHISRTTTFISWGVATVFILLATTQLITYEKFFPIMQGYQVIDGVFGKILASVLVISEVFALPFILRMSVSRLFRYLSLFFAYTTGIIWTFLGVWAIYTNPPTTGSGMFGGVLQHIPAEISLFLGLFLLGAVVTLHKLLHNDMR